MSYFFPYFLFRVKLLFYAFMKGHFSVTFFFVTEVNLLCLVDYL